MKLSCKSRGSALLLSLWAVLVLSVAVFALAKYVDQQMGTVREANIGLDAKALAYSGMEVALNPLVSPKTPALRAQFGPNRGYEVKMIGEGGKLDLNYFLNEQSPERIAVLKNYLALKGLKFNEIQRLIDCLLDWVDPDNLKHINGAEAEGDYQPRNGPLQSLDEVAKVKGSEPLVSLPNWQDDFTVYTRGPIDLQYASAALISCLPGVGAMRANLFVQTRNGRDKIEGTLDDVVFRSPAEALSYLGIQATATTFPADLVTVSQPNQGIFRIASVGTSGKVSRHVVVVAQKNAGPNPNILLWKEN